MVTAKHYVFWTNPTTFTYQFCFTSLSNPVFTFFVDNNFTALNNAIRDSQSHYKFLI
jgi:hypothetical protein